MNNFQYYNPVEMIFGRGLESTVGEHVVCYGGTKVLKMCIRDRSIMIHFIVFTSRPDQPQKRW